MHMCVCVHSVHMCGCEPVCVCCEIRMHVYDCPVCVWGGEGVQHT